MVSTKRHAMNKEADIEKEMSDHGFELIEDTSLRTTGRGDKVMRCIYNNAIVMIDNKSTKSIAEITITKSMLDKIAIEADSESKRKKQKIIPILTFTIFRAKRKFLIIEIEDLEELLLGVRD